MPYVFFTSYAHLDNESSTLSDVISDLRERVRAKTGLPAQQVAFFDATEIAAGSEWEARLAAAVHSEARVLVCMCSPTLWNSEYCAREFDVFQRRLAAAAPAAVKAIIPVC